MYAYITFIIDPQVPWLLLSDGNGKEEEEEGSTKADEMPKWGIASCWIQRNFR